MLREAGTSAAGDLARRIESTLAAAQVSDARLATLREPRDRCAEDRERMERVLPYVKATEREAFAARSNPRGKWHVAHWIAEGVVIPACDGSAMPMALPTWVRSDPMPGDYVSAADVPAADRCRRSDCAFMFAKQDARRVRLAPAEASDAG